jgi:hypothetical protein
MPPGSRRAIGGVKREAIAWRQGGAPSAAVLDGGTLSGVRSAKITGWWVGSWEIELGGQRVRGGQRLGW